MKDLEQDTFARICDDSDSLVQAGVAIDELERAADIMRERASESLANLVVSGVLDPIAAEDVLNTMEWRYSGASENATSQADEQVRGSDIFVTAFMRRL